MIAIKLFNNKKYNSLGAFSENDDKPHSLHSHNSYLKQKLHEKRVDEFFWTDTTAPKKRHSPLAAIGAILGVVIPTVMLGKKQHKIKIDSLKNLWKAIDVEYGLKEILITGLGGGFGGLLGGLLDRKEKNKLQKIDEAAFQCMNIAFPAILVAKGIELCSKTKGLNNLFAKVLCSAGGIFAGAWGAVFLSNKLDDKVFDKYQPDPDRKLKKKDFIVHVDDFFATLILAKVPFVDKLHINRLLPAIFSWSGYHAGDT